MALEALCSTGGGGGTLIGCGCRGADLAWAPVGSVRAVRSRVGARMPERLVPLEEAPFQEVTGRGRQTAETSRAPQEVPIHVCLQAVSRWPS